MPLIKAVNNKKPDIADNVYCADNSTIIGDVIIDNDTSIWFNAVIRGDVNSIVIGKRVNIQDGAVIHATYKKSKTIIGDNVSIGHNAVIHGCTINNNVLIGMGAIIMDRSVIESNSVIAAGSVVTEGSEIKSGFLYTGTPAIQIRKLTNLEIEKLIENTASNYLLYSSWFKV